MMKNYAIYFLLFTGLFAYAQGNRYASSIGVSGGYAEDGIGFMATYNHHTNRNQYAQLSIFGSIAEDKGEYNIPYRLFTVQPGYFLKVLEQRTFKRYGLYVGGGGVFGYEVINNGSTVLNNGALIDAKSQFLYGLYLGIEGEYTLGDSISFLLKANEYYHINSDVGNFYPYVGIGIRYFLF